LINISGIDAVSLSISEAQAVSRPLLLFVAGIVIYSIFIFKFYRFLASRDIFKLNLQQYSSSFFGFLEKIFNIFFYIIEYLIIFPLFTFFWFLVVATLLTILSEMHDISNILLISMALVGSIRVTAYYNEDLSRDLAKMLPFVLLGVFILDISFFSYAGAIETLKLMPSMWKQMIYYLGFIIMIEFVLRVITGILSPFRHKKEEKEKIISSMLSLVASSALF